MCALQIFCICIFIIITIKMRHLIIGAKSSQMHMQQLTNCTQMKIGSGNVQLGCSRVLPAECVMFDDWS